MRYTGLHTHRMESAGDRKHEGFHRDVLVKSLSAVSLWMFSVKRLPFKKTEALV